MFVSVHSINIPYIVMPGLTIAHIARGPLLMHRSFGTGKWTRAISGVSWLSVFGEGRKRREYCFLPSSHRVEHVSDPGLSCPLKARAL